MVLVDDEQLDEVTTEELPRCDDDVADDRVVRGDQTATTFQRLVDDGDPLGVAPSCQRVELLDGPLIGEVGAAEFDRHHHILARSHHGSVTSWLFRDPTTHPLMAEQRNRVIWPLIRYGLGMMHFKFGRLDAPGRRPLNLLGHSGATGSWLFYCPELDLFTTGTVDEVGARAFPFRFIPRLLRAIAS